LSGRGALATSVGRCMGIAESLVGLILLVALSFFSCDVEMARDAALLERRDAMLLVGESCFAGLSSSMQYAVCSMQYAVCSMQYAVCCSNFQ